MEQLFINFREKVKQHHNLVESICLSNSSGLIWCEQYTPSNRRNIYSHSKSFTSLMVGIAIDEGMLTLDTRLSDVFKDEMSKEEYQKLYKIKVKHLLNMSSGFDQPCLFTDQRISGQGYPDYLKFMFSLEVKVEPGSKFFYSNGDTYLLSRIVSKVYNRNFTQLCYEKIFKPLEIGLPMWGVDPMGYCIAASELCLSVIDMNKLGILFKNNGVYKGKRIISEEYVKMCSSPQISTNGGWGDYSFQFWMVPECNAYRADGAYGQLTIIFKNHDYILSFQRPEDDKLNIVLDILREEVFNKIK